MNRALGETAGQTINLVDMDWRVASGRAHYWTCSLGPDSEVPNAAKLDQQWWVVVRGDEDYRLAPEDIAEALDIAEAALILAGR